MRMKLVVIGLLMVGAIAGTAAPSRAQLVEQTTGVVGSNKAPKKVEIGAQAVEGCLKPSTPGKYRIDNAKLLKGDAAGTGKTFQTYQLALATKDVKLADHVGHKVELTGSVIEGSSSDPPRFFLTELKMLSTSCP